MHRTDANTSLPGLRPASSCAPKLTEKLFPRLDSVNFAFLCRRCPNIWVEATFVPLHKCHVCKNSLSEGHPDFASCARHVWRWHFNCCQCTVFSSDHAFTHCPPRCSRNLFPCHCPPPSERSRCASGGLSWAEFSHTGRGAPSCDGFTWLKCDAVCNWNTVTITCFLSPPFRQKIVGIANLWRENQGPNQTEESGYM